MLHFGLFLLLATCASAAYVQWKHCDGYKYEQDGFMLEMLSAGLVHINETHDWLSLRVGGRIQKSTLIHWVDCFREFRPESDLSVLYLTPADNTDPSRFHSLSTFHTTIHLISVDAKEEGCLEANITPVMSPNIQATLRYAPLSILLFVLFVGIARSVTGSDPASKDRSSPQAMLPGFADCLHINDGIYEINGTFGGTFGLEIMTQIIGALMTMDTWLNMVILIMAITVLSALCLGAYSHWNRPVHSDSGSDSYADLLHTFDQTLRVVLSYFMLPLIALSFYQLDNAGYLPPYHTLLAIFVIIAIIAAFIWLLTSIPTRSLGVLIFDHRRRYRQVSPESGSGHKTFALALFLLYFIRGIAIGRLQISGRAQLAVLGTCELVLLACIVQFQAYSIFSIGTISAVARLGSLMCMIAFVPGVVSNNARSAVGYLVLVLHACMLVLGFFLRRRQASRDHLPDRTNSTHTSIGSNIDQESPGYLGPRHGYSDSTSVLRADSPSISGRDYYRPPRHPRISSSYSIDHQRRKDVKETLASRDPSTDDDPGRYSSRETGSSELIQSAPISPETLASTTETGSLHPRWADYSFRESDLFYGVPRPTSAEASSDSIETSAPSTSRRRIPSLSALNIWRKVSGQRSTTEQGFSVVRPPRPSNYSPM
ncbi:hypothetical protein F4781DRAFT_425261 [Annulohypoxylon bovei var. microspora]|nr:hypothetical protein F4781DRAFT_425261 [Annulohypoxylon bovei var. microspora]